MTLDENGKQNEAHFSFISDIDLLWNDIYASFIKLKRTKKEKKKKIKIKLK